MNELHPSGCAAAATAIALMLTFVLGPSTASAARDRTPPTTPTNFRVTGKTSYTASLAWSPSSDNSGNFSYVISFSGGVGAPPTSVLPKIATSVTLTSGLDAGYSHTFSIYAVDAAGNKSQTATVTTILPADTTPPGASVPSVTDVGPTHVSLSWTPAIDDGPYVSYQIYVNDGPPLWVGTDTSFTIAGLDPETTYTFTVQARDTWRNVSLSNPVTVTTEPANPNDTTPPTTPANFGATSFGEETWLSWEQSTDNLTPQSLIPYEVYVNGVLDHTLVGRGETILYGTAGMINTFEVIAVDESGNKSVPASVQVDLR